MEINSLKCPNCAGKLIEVHSRKRICPYCDSEFRIGDSPDPDDTTGRARIVRDICLNANIKHYSVIIGKSMVNGKAFSAVRKYFEIPQGENCFLINDATIFSDFKKGFAICTTGLYLSMNSKKKHYIKWEHFRDIDLRYNPAVNENQITIDSFHCFVCSATGKLLYNLLLEIQNSV